MADPRQVVSVATIREAAKAYGEGRTMRDVAAEVGISLTSLHNFLHGAEPRPANRKKLTEWYVRTMPQRGEVLSPEMAGAFLALMLDGIPQRSGMRRNVRCGKC